MGECGIQKEVFGQRYSLRPESPNEHHIQRNWAEMHKLDLTRDNEVGKADSKEKVAGGPE